MTRPFSPNDDSSAPPEHAIEVASGEKARPEQESVYVFPATLAQRRFWLLHQLQPRGNPALNMPVPLRLRGRLDPRQLRRALNAVVARHEALRTTVVSEGGDLQQVIAPELTLDLPVVRANLRALDRLLRQEAEQPFQLASGPLLRARLVRFEEEDHLLLLTLHHIISDGWSNGLLVRELFAFYVGFQTNESPALAELPIQFADYAHWQEERIEAGDFDWQREYWRRQLAGELPALDLPVDRPRLRARARAGEICGRRLPPRLVEAVRSLAAQEGASPFMVYLSVFEVLLHRYTGQADFLVSSPSANRERPEFEPVIGLFVNPLLLRADLRGDPSFREVLARVRAGALDGFANQDVPFELLLDEFKGSRLQVNFLHQRVFFEKTTLPDGLTIEPLSAPSAGVIYEISAALLEDSQGARLELEYDPALFETATIERMLGHYETLLQNALTTPDRAVAGLPILSAQERKILGLEEGPSPASGSGIDLRRVLAARVLARPDAVAVHHGKRELSCAELLAWVENVPPNKAATPATDLEQLAARVAQWRARSEVPVSSGNLQLPGVQSTFLAAARMLFDSLGLQPDERVASFSIPGPAATEELGTILLAEAILVYPTPEMMGASASAIIGWLERERISVAFMAAATWNRLAAAFGKKLARPQRLRLIITEGAPNEGTFGRVAMRARRRVVIGPVGTVALARKTFPAAARLRVVDLQSGEPVPIGVVGRLITLDDVDTGELARWRADGSIERLGRIEEQISFRGLRLDLRQVENFLARIEGIRHALVRPVGEGSARRLVAYLLPQAANDPLPNDAKLRQLLREKNLPDELLPTAFVRLKEFPACAEEGRLDLESLPPAPEGKRPAAENPVRPYIGLQLQLIAIWEDVLGVSGIGIRDNFFELGGNSLLAMRMLQRAEVACGKEILPAALFRNPTIENLAGEIAQDVMREAPTLLQVNESGTKAPFFYLHGDLFGGGFYSLQLSRALGLDQPFYVLPPADTRSSLLAPTIEEMAAAHLAALRAVRPHGPYVIGGFCMGGVVGYELARQIEASGEKVEMLLIIDSGVEEKALRRLRSLGEKMGPWLGWNHEAQLRHFGAWANWLTRLAWWRNLPLQRRARIFGRRLYQLTRRAVGLPAHRSRSIVTVQATESHALARDLPATFRWAAAGYRPQSYHSEIALLLSEDVAPDSAVAAQWRRLAPKVTVHPLPGRHLECITAHVDSLAATIRLCLESVRGRGGPDFLPNEKSRIT
jgi:non-ribosomal peptide synthetase component F/thioesterase domain-containing protein